MERIFWVECPDCHGKYYCDYELRHAGLELICPYCQRIFDEKIALGKPFSLIIVPHKGHEGLGEESPFIDDRAG